MDRTRSSAEYSTQLFDLPPAAIIEIIVGTVESTVTDCMDSMHESLLGSLSDIPKQEINSGTEAMKTKFADKMKTIGSRLENFFQECVLKIPEHVLLPEDAAQRQKCSTKDQKKIQKEIDALKLDYDNALYMSEILTGKIQEAKESYGRYKTVRNEMEAMVKVFSENQLTDVTENCEFIKKKVPASANASPRFEVLRS